MNILRQFSLIFLVLVSFTAVTHAQLGAIVYPAPAVTVLNPDGDAWTTSCSCPFALDDQTESELNWDTIASFELEPTGDNVGGPCGAMDIVDLPDPGRGCGYKGLVDPNAIPDEGDETFTFRLRLGKDPGNAVFGFSVLIDLDLTIGTAISCTSPDPNPLVGNPGFEIEVRVKNQGGGKGVYLDDIDGLIVGINRAFYPLTTNTQRSNALLGGGCGNPVFYEFAVPLADLNTWFGVTSTTKLRMAVCTSADGQSALNASAMDIGGINDADYPTDDSAFTKLICSQKAITLPIELLSFEAWLNQKNEVDIAWVTLAETNNDYFTVQRSKDGLNFEEVAIVNAKGNSNTFTDYTAFDKHPYSGISYYRLKQTDFDGDYTFSELVAISNDALSGTISLYPNPTSGSIIVNNTGSQTGDAVITDVLGRTVISESLNSYPYTIDLSTQSPGVYFISIQTGEDNFAQKLILTN